MPIFNPGLKLLLKAANTPLEPNPDHPIAYLHFVDGDGNTIVPEYEPDGLRTSAGPVSGAKYTIVSTTELQTLKDRVAALEAMLDGTGTVTFARVITGFLSAPPTAPTRSLTIQVPGALAESYEDVIEMAWTTTDMTPAVKLGFFGGSPVVQQTIPKDSALADTEAALEASNLIERLP